MFFKLLIKACCSMSQFLVNITVLLVHKDIALVFLFICKSNSSWSLGFLSKVFLGMGIAIDFKLYCK